MSNENVFVDQIEVADNGVVQVRTCTQVFGEMNKVSASFHRHVVAPGDDYSKQDARVKAICAATHTAAVVAAYKAAQDAAKP